MPTEFGFNPVAELFIFLGLEFFGITSFACSLVFILIGVRKEILVTGVSIAYLALVFSFKTPKDLGIFSLSNAVAPRSSSSDGSPLMQLSCALTLIAAGLVVFKIRMHIRSRTTWCGMLRWLGILLVLLVTVTSLGARGADIFIRAWYGMDQSSVALPTFALATLLSLGPVLYWMMEMELRCESVMLIEITRCGGARRWVLREIRQAWIASVKPYIIVVVVSLIISWVAAEGKWGEWGLPFPMGIAIMILIGVGGLNLLVIISCILMVRMFTGSANAGVVTLGVLVGFGYIWGNKGFPVAQYSLGLYQSEIMSELGLRILILCMLSVVFVGLLVGPIAPRVRHVAINEGNRHV